MKQIITDSVVYCIIFFPYIFGIIYIIINKFKKNNKKNDIDVENVEYRVRILEENNRHFVNAMNAMLNMIDLLAKKTGLKDEENEKKNDWNSKRIR